MKIEEAVKIIEEKYKTKKYSPQSYYIVTNLMFTFTTYITIALKELDEKLYISDIGSTFNHTTKSEEEMIEICKQNNVNYDEGYIMVEFTKVEDVDNVINAIKQIAKVYDL